MKIKLLLGAGLLCFLALPLLPGQGEPLLKIGPTISFGKFKDLSGDNLVKGLLPGFDVAIPFAKQFEICGSYRFSKTTYRMGHGSDRVFRLDAFAVGLRWKPVRLENGEPFVGAGMNGYVFGDDPYTPFILPVKSAFGPYVQGGAYVRLLRFLQVQLAARYNLVRHTEKRTTPYGTYHYRTDFSGFEFGLGLLACIPGH